MGFWFWILLLGFIAAASYKRRIRPLVLKATGSSTLGAALTAILLILVSLIIGFRSEGAFLFHGISAAGIWFLIFLTGEHIQQKTNAAEQLKRQEMNRKVVEFYEASKQQAKRVAVKRIQPNLTSPPPPKIKPYAQPDEEVSTIFPSLKTGEEVQLAYEIASADHVMRRRLVAALQRRAQQMADDADSPEPGQLVSKPGPEMVPVKLLPDPGDPQPLQLTRSLSPPAPPPPPKPPEPPADAPVLATRETSGFKYEPKLVESKFGQATAATPPAEPEASG